MYNTGTKLTEASALMWKVYSFPYEPSTGYTAHVMHLLLFVFDKISFQPLFLFKYS